MSKSQSELERY